MAAKSEFGRGFIVNLMLLSRHFGLPPERAFIGAADHLNDFIVPEQFRGPRSKSSLSVFARW